MCSYFNHRDISKDNKVYILLVAFGIKINSYCHFSSRTLANVTKVIMNEILLGLVTKQV